MPAKPAHFTTLRILAGDYKGRAFASPARATTHPMGAREKLALFNMLQPYLSGASVLDAYAGSGALGLEALSRGAARVVFVEQSAPVVRTLRQNLRAVLPVARLADAEIIQSSVATFATHGAANSAPDELTNPTPDAPAHPAQGATPHSTPFNLILADPPYDHFNPAEVAALAPLLHPTGMLALSFPAQLAPPTLPGLTCLKSHRYAAAGLALYSPTA